MDKKIIFVNNPAAVSGGALSILKQFIEEVALKLNNNFVTYIFCNVDLSEYNCEKVKIINNIKIKRGLGRITWDLFGLKKWSRKNSIKPDLLISLQNTAISGFNNVKQIVYLHQSIPYYKNIKWSIMKKEERIYWFYRYIYKAIIHFSIKNNYVVVQNNWMKKAILKDHKVKNDHVKIVKPKFSSITRYKSVEIDKRVLFYPSSGEIYKNHIVLVEALNLLVNNFNMRDLKLCFTISKTNFKNKLVLEKINQYNLEDNIDFLGYLKAESLNEYYSKANLVLFPSYIETVGLPLLEAASLNKKILCSDLYYSREALENYKSVKYIKYDDYKNWALFIKDSLYEPETTNEVLVNNDKNWCEMINFISLLLYGEKND
ncbi:glycosyltransferase [Clostridium perfringens]|nr:glycosyltransferase [Clostridium perfringens]MDK0410524.1 glycosyltransferase [Clostridium perfringens]MDK0444776.1 glycosyltransferase [Clostridium perfringens]MDK0498512.1 glycosyltransferase [Clostridium perfringens]MDK0501432.1 glycosyltransferase [Clostridium perfringens]